MRPYTDRVKVVLTGPAVLRPAFSLLRRFAPVLRVGRTVVAPGGVS